MDNRWRNKKAHLASKMSYGYDSYAYDISTLGVFRAHASPSFDEDGRLINFWDFYSPDDINRDDDAATGQRLVRLFTAPSNGAKTAAGGPTQSTGTPSKRSSSWSFKWPKQLRKRSSVSQRG